jgi:hypothetical protein
MLARIASGDWSIRQGSTAREEWGNSARIIKHRGRDIRKMMFDAQVEQGFSMHTPFEQKLSGDLFLKIATFQEAGVQKDGS